MKKLIDIPKLIRNLWVILWIVEFILIVMKKYFNVWYPIVVENETILQISNFITNNMIVNYVIMFTLYLFNLNFIYLTSSRKKFFWTKYELIFVSVIIVGTFFIKNYNNALGMLTETFVLIVLPTINNIRRLTKEKGLLRFLIIIFPIIINGLIMVWQLNILFIRNINELLKDMPFVIYFVIQIDYYIFLILTWIGVNYYMSLVGAWFFSKQLTKYEALREKELAKEVPDKKYVESLDKKIANLRARMK